MSDASTPPPNADPLRSPSADLTVNRVPRRADVQGLRAIAILLVVVFHAGLPLPGGFTGVDVFFVISGFVITGTLYRELAAGDRISVGKFYVRRVKRLLPALAVMLVVVAVVGILATPVATIRIGPTTGMFASLFSSNGYLFTLPSGYFDLSGALNPLLHTWTLAVEEQFYVVFPLLLLVVWRLARRRATPGASRVIVATVVAGVCVASLGLALVMRPQFVFYASPTRAWEFGAGALVALLAPLIVGLWRPLALALGTIGAGAIVATAALAGDRSGEPAMAALPAVAGACALLIAGTASLSGASSLLATRPLVWIGDRSYSWYLWHWPLIVFATAFWPLSKWAPPVAAAVSLLPAWLSYRYVENPIRFNARIRGRRALQLAGVCIVVPAGACAAWLLADDRLVDGVAKLSSAHASQQRSIGSLRQCFGPFRPGSAATDACTWPARASRGRAVLFGDSIATTSSEPFVAAATRAGLDATVASQPGCAFIDLRVSTVALGASACRAYYEDSIDELIRARPRLVVLTHVNTYLSNTNVVLAAADGRGRTTDREAKAALWRRGLASTIARLNAARIPVLVVLPIPSLRFSPAECAVAGVLLDACDGGRSRAAVDRQRRDIVAADESAVRGASGAASLDLIERLCTQHTCPMTRDGVVLYSDRVHLSVAGATAMTDLFARAQRVAERSSARLR